jgi:gliding motility-associated lipoprotein GldD
MRKYVYALTVLFLFSGQACKKEYVPKPRAYFRISFQDKTYHKLDSTALPYRFEIPDYGRIVPDHDRLAEPFWVNLEIPKHKAEVHLSYKKVENNLMKLIESSRKLAYDHSFKADAIEERIFVNPEKKVFGTIYLIDGNAASSLQFYLTDSTRHFLRGALYIREVPNIDSIRPVIEFLTPDVIRLIESTEWKN